MHNQEVLLSQVEKELSSDIERTFQNEILDDNGDVLFIGETHNDPSQREIAIRLIQIAIKSGKKPNFFGVELPSTNPSTLTESQRKVLEEFEEIINFCQQNQIPVVGIDWNLQQGKTASFLNQEREDEIAQNIQTAYDQFGEGMVLIGEWHSRKASGIGTSDKYRAVQTCANILSEKLRIRSVLMHRMSRGDPLARKIDKEGVPFAQKGELAWMYAPVRGVIGNFSNDGEELIGVATERDHDLTILIPSKASDINKLYGEEGTKDVKYLS